VWGISLVLTCDVDYCWRVILPLFLIWPSFSFPKPIKLFDCLLLTYRNRMPNYFFLPCAKSSQPRTQEQNAAGGSAHSPRNPRTPVCSANLLLSTPSAWWEGRSALKHFMRTLPKRLQYFLILSDWHERWRQTSGRFCACPRESAASVSWCIKYSVISNVKQTPFASFCLSVCAHPSFHRVYRSSSRKAEDCWRRQPSGILHRVVSYKLVDVSEVRTVSIFKAVTFILAAARTWNLTFVFRGKHSVRPSIPTCVEVKEKIYQHIRDNRIYIDEISSERSASNGNTRCKNGLRSNRNCYIPDCITKLADSWNIYTEIIEHKNRMCRNCVIKLSLILCLLL
jgi:hypothetical protein